jgi:N-acetylmuramoyl-L-alanine amidase
MSVKIVLDFKCQLLVFLAIFLIWGTSHAADTPVEENKAPHFVVVLDPGHGGDDSGQHLSPAVLEKDFTLKVAQDLKLRLTRDTDKTVWLTRVKDTAVSLKGRQSLANAKNAQVFISIHAADGSLKPQAVFVFRHRVIDDERLNDLTNKAKESNLPAIPWEMAQEPVQAQSGNLAKHIGKALESANWPQMESPVVYIQEVPITVLTGVKAPGVLVEFPLPNSPATKTYDLFCRQTSEALAAGINEFLGRR